MRTKLFAATALAAAVIPAAPAAAKEYRGTCIDRDAKADTFTLATASGRTVTIESARQPRVGRRVVVKARRASDGSLDATSVKVVRKRVGGFEVEGNVLSVSATEIVLGPEDGEDGAVESENLTVTVPEGTDVSGLEVGDEAELKVKVVGGKFVLLALDELEHTGDRAEDDDDDVDDDDDSDDHGGGHDDPRDDQDDDSPSDSSDDD